jgi:hypothetical protein
MAKITTGAGSSDNSAQRTNYKKTSSQPAGTNKLLATAKLPMIKAGGPSGHGPTGSSQSYPKGSSVSMKPDFNPQKGSASTYGLMGV